jgi:hypothetical protein
VDAGKEKVRRQAIREKIAHASHAQAGLTNRLNPDATIGLSRQHDIICCLLVDIL